MFFVRESKRETLVRQVIFGSLVIPYIMFGIFMCLFPHLRNLVMPFIYLSRDLRRRIVSFPLWTQSLLGTTLLLYLCFFAQLCVCVFLSMFLRPGSSARRESCLYLDPQFKGIIAQNDLQIFSRRQYFEACTVFFLFIFNFFLKNRQRAVVITFSQHNPQCSLLSQNEKICLRISGCNVFHF